ncbi:MAG: hypothetical protein KAY32_16240 [Candidatus Eisenbacteria sp.]|nr:hypothetical protein [Candidatus Eisenbacteria bacterium]
MAPSIRPNHLAMTLPYAAVLIGLYWLGSAWVAILLYHAGMGIFLLRCGSSKQRPGLLQGWSAAAGTVLSVTCAGTGPLLILLWPTAAGESHNISAILAAFGLHGGAWWLFAAYYVIVHPLLEEAFWRGAQFSGHRGVALGDVAFAGYHALVLQYFLSPPWVLASVVSLLFVAWIWRRVGARYGGLAIPVVSHAAAGLSTMLAAYILARG